jgi:hypothetical protein
VTARSLFLAIAATAVALSGAAVAAGAWSTPEQIPGPSAEPFVNSTWLSYDATGRAVASWTAVSPPPSVTATAWRPPGGAWLRGADRASADVAPLARYARDRVVMLIGRQSPRPPAGGVFVAFGRLGDAPRGARRIGDQEFSDLAIAADPRGDAIAVVGTGRSGPTLVKAANRPAQGRFVRLRTISRTWSRFPAVAIDSVGNGIVAWWRKVGGGRRVVEARLYRPHGGWSPVERVAELPPSEPLVSVAAAHGTFLVAWASHDISSGGEDRGTEIGAAVRRHDGRWRSRTLERTQTGGGIRLAAGIDFAGIRALVDARGHGTVVWGGQQGSALRIEAVRIDRAQIGTTVVLPSLTGFDALFSDAVIAGDGRIGIAWIETPSVFGTSPPAPSALSVAVVAPGPLAPAATVVARPERHANSSRLAFDPATETLTAVWSERSTDGSSATVWASDLRP